MNTLILLLQLLFVSVWYSGILDDAEYACYCKWFEYIMKISPPHLDLIGEIRHCVYDPFLHGRVLYIKNYFVCSKST